MTHTQFAEANKISLTSDYAPQNPNMDDNWSASHYRCTLKHDGRRMSFYFSKGSALKEEPQIDEVLSCLASDAASVRNAGGFDDWASELGYDTDSRKAEKIYRACVRSADKLESFLGGDLFQELLWEVTEEEYAPQA